MRVLYLDLDALRPDRLGCYGYHRDTSPNIDRIAKDAFIFNNYYCSDAPCLPSRTAFVTGLFGIHSGVVNHGGMAADIRLEGIDRGFRNTNRQSMAKTFGQAGYRPVLISPFANRHAIMEFYSGFSEIYDTGRGGMEDAQEVTPVVLDWLDRNGESDNWFLHINYWDVHTPYRAPEEFGNPFENEPLPEWPDEKALADHWKQPGGHSAQDNWMYTNKIPNPEGLPRMPGEIKGLEGFRQVTDGYDCAIKYLDSHLGQIFDWLEKAGVLEDTAIIISADHAENMGELGIYCEHATADHANCRVPLIVRWPGQAGGGQTCEGLHYNIDMLPTLADMLEQKHHPSWDGTSFADTLKGKPDQGHDELIISQCAHTVQRSVRWDDYLYIRTYHDFYHLYPKEMLFNIKEDRFETNDLAEKRPDLVREGVYRYMKWHDRMMETMPEGYTTDPLRTVLAEGGPLHSKGHLPEYLKRLESSGRGEFVDALKARHLQEFGGRGPVV